jgi:hypothetical protein
VFILGEHTRQRTAIYTISALPNSGSSFHPAASGRFQNIALKLWYGYPVAPQFSILRLPAFKNKNRYMKRRNPPYTVIADVYPGIAA